MRRATFLFTILVLGGCSSSSMPSLDSVPPAAQASSKAQSSGVAQVQPESESQAEPDSKDRSAILNTEQRADIEDRVRKGVANPNSAIIRSMIVRLTEYTPRSYIACGWVDPGITGPGGNQPFVVMYFPAMRRAWLIGLGDTESKATAVHQKCVAEGVPLKA